MVALCYHLRYIDLEYDLMKEILIGIEELQRGEKTEYQVGKVNGRFTAVPGGEVSRMNRQLRRNEVKT